MDAIRVHPSEAVSSFFSFYITDLLRWVLFY